MWKVTNSRNKDILINFHKQVALPFFDLIAMLIHAKEIGTPTLLQSTEDLEDNPEFAQLLPIQQEALMIVLSMKKQENFDSCIDYLIDLVNLTDLTGIEQLKRIYENDYEQLNEHLNFNLPKRVVPSSLAIIFRNYFYNSIAETRLWDILLNGAEYSRQMFHTNFRNENALAVCPYCDIDEMMNKFEVQIEHFLPRNSFPLLSMAPLNLFSACGQCNSLFVKGARYMNQITTPLHENIGNKLQFQKPLVGGPISIGYDRARQDIANYLDLLRLENRYNDQHLMVTLEMKLLSLDSHLASIVKIGGKVTKEYIDDFIKNKQKTDSLTCITSQLYREFDQYKGLP